MSYYTKELNALTKAQRYRKKVEQNPSLADFGSNDYLGLAHNAAILEKTYDTLIQQPSFGPKASLLVGGYTRVHKDFEKKLSKLNGFEDAVVVGSGFLANLALIEALVRKKDIVLLDELYHASGVLASELQNKEVVFFKHNDMNHLEELLRTYQNKNRVLVAVEGVYSMLGDMVPKEVFALCDRYNALLIVDEAHSSGVVGENLLGVFDLYQITPKPNHIKMGTLGKAYGSYGAYILASSEIISFLINRAKPLIYTTALSLFDTLYAHNALEYIQLNKTELKKKIASRQQTAKEITGVEMSALILPVEVGVNKQVVAIQKQLQAMGYFVGAIRQPSVQKPIVRLIARVDESKESFATLLKRVMELVGKC